LFFILALYDVSLNRESEVQVLELPWIIVSTLILLGQIVIITLLSLEYCEKNDLCHYGYWKTFSYIYEIIMAIILGVLIIVEMYKRLEPYDEFYTTTDILVLVFGYARLLTVTLTLEFFNPSYGSKGRISYFSISLLFFISSNLITFGANSVSKTNAYISYGSLMACIIISLILFSFDCRRSPSTLRFNDYLLIVFSLLCFGASIAIFVLLVEERDGTFMNSVMFLALSIQLLITTLLTFYLRYRLGSYTKMETPEPIKMEEEGQSPTKMFS